MMMQATNAECNEILGPRWAEFCHQKLKPTGPNAPLWLRIAPREEWSAYLLYEIAKFCREHPKK